MIYLINPNEREILENAGDRYPLSLLYIASYLKKTGYKVKLFDMNHILDSFLLNKIKEDKPDYICISVYTSPILKASIRLKEKVVQFIKENNLKTPKFVAGGYHATAMPETLLSSFDYIVRYEGEKFMETIKKEPDKKIVIPEKEKVLDNLPFPAWDLVDMNKYNMIQNGKRTATVNTSRGCPYNCIFCGNVNKKVRYHSPWRVFEEVKILKEKYSFESFYFIDDIFTLNKDRIYKILELLKPLNIKFRCMTRADLIDNEMAKKLAEAGCEIINLGIESASNKILKAIGKVMTIEQNKNTIKILHKYGICVKGFFIFGLPEETKEDAEKTIKFAKEMKNKGLVTADFYRLVPFPGTKIWERPEDYGIEILDRDFTSYMQVGKKAKPKIRTKWLNENEIEKLVIRAKEEFDKQ